MIKAMNPVAAAVLTLSLFLVFNSTLLGNSDSKANALFAGMEIPRARAMTFAPGLVSTMHHEHSRLNFSKDGKTLIWAVIPIDRDPQKNKKPVYRTHDQSLWFSKIQSNRLTKPAILDYVKISGGFSPAFSVDGKRLYYKTSVPDADPRIRPKPSQQWSVSYEGDRWGDAKKIPKLIPSTKNRASMSLCFAQNGTLYFDLGGPRSTGQWEWHILKSEYQNGHYLTPVKLDPVVNGTDNELSWCPWIAPDESYIIYSSSRSGELGNGDLYINFRKGDGTWSKAINMGPRVNSKYQERFPSVSPDGRLLFFARKVEESYSDFYWIDATIIKELKKQL